MSKFVSESLPPEVEEAFDGKSIESKVGPAYLVVTTDPDGTPRPCMLSAGEVLALDKGTIRLGLWPGSNTAGNLNRGESVLICFVREDTVFYIKGIPKPLARSKTAPVDRFEVSVLSVESDVHEGLPVTHGINFGCRDDLRPKLLRDWSRTIEALRES